MNNQPNYSRLYQAIIKSYSSIPMAFVPGLAAPPLQVFIEVTYNCNLRCSFCQFLDREDDPSVHDNTEKPHKELTVSQFQRIVATIPRTSIISFTGGEPLVKRGIIDLLQYTAGRNKMHIFTNATRIDEVMAGELCAMAVRNIFDHGLVLVGISLEGSEQTHNRIVGKSWAFNKTISGVEALLSRRAAGKRKYPLIELKTVVSAENVADISEVFDLARAMQVDIFNLMILNQLPHARRIDRADALSIHHRPPPPPPVDLHILREQLRLIQCKAAGGSIQIRTTPQGITFDQIFRYYSGDPGTFNGCRCYYPWYGCAITAYGGISICPYVPLGNLQNGSLRTLLNNQPAREFRKSLRKDKFYPGCSGCCMLVP